ncbi:inositol monophosphatase family protein [Orrella sp. 11846]|uniref:inositol monophosphatase family protein n=1 Tax=Orrella sp. 11846 TaxID=3409913 RepID=UPI003B5A1C9A
MPSLTDCLNLATQAARAGAAVLRDFQKQPDSLIIDFKGRNDLVSQADRQSEKVIIETLRQGTPNMAIIAEESGAVSGKHATWHIDPLDGTTNYLHGLGYFAVSIGLMAHAGSTDASGNILTEDTPILGVVYDPTREEMFTAIRGEGAFLNGQPIQQSNVQSLDHALIAAGIQVRRPEDLEAYLRIIHDLAQSSRGIRRFGAAALDLAWLACARVDGYVEEKLESWDVVAGTVIAREAGALVSDPLLPEDNWPKAGRVVASGPTLHDQLIAFYRQHMQLTP